MATPFRCRGLHSKVIGYLLDFGSAKAPLSKKMEFRWWQLTAGDRIVDSVLTNAEEASDFAC